MTEWVSKTINLMAVCPMGSSVKDADDVCLQPCTLHGIEDKDLAETWRMFEFRKKNSALGYLPVLFTYTQMTSHTTLDSRWLNFQTNGLTSDPCSAKFIVDSRHISTCDPQKRSNCLHPKYWTQGTDFSQIFASPVVVITWDLLGNQRLDIWAHLWGYFSMLSPSHQEYGWIWMVYHGFGWFMMASHWTLSIRLTLVNQFWPSTIFTICRFRIWSPGHSVVRGSRGLQRPKVHRMGLEGYGVSKVRYQHADAIPTHKLRKSLFQVLACLSYTSYFHEVSMSG